MGRLWEMEVPVVRLGSVRSVKTTVKAQSEVPVVLGVSPVDQWKFTPSGKSPVPQQGR
jgi:hypothetical protein